ncbi:MAG: HEAT repeat domain-containing protein [Rivularia sp. (in: Bacteria)]|nr:HEAT repeat domain-containing protein [Rivularia sp. MS3]
MNENFNNINWDEINEPDIHEEMLFAIRNLASNNEDIRSESLSNLFDFIWHQGTLSPKSAFAVPFLIARLQQETQAEILDEILIMLTALGTGSSYCDAHQVLPIYEDRRNTVEFKERMEEELNDVQATHTAVYKGINVYLDLLEHQSKDVRISAVFALSCCRQNVARICSKLYTRFSCESDELVKATIPLCLVHLSQCIPVQIAFLEEILKSNESDIVKLSAAVSLAYIAGEHMSDHALDVLINKLQKPDLLIKLCEHYDLSVATNGLIIIDFFSRLNHRHIGIVISTLLKIEKISYMMDDLFELVFNEKIIPEGSFFRDLTDTEQLIIKAIVEDNTLDNVSYMGGFLDKLGGDGLVIKQKLIGFINGERLKYER